MVEKKILTKAGTPVHVGKPARAQRVLCMEPTERTVKLDEDTVKEVAAAARVMSSSSELMQHWQRSSRAAATEQRERRQVALQIQAHQRLVKALRGSCLAFCCAHRCRWLLGRSLRAQCIWGLW